MPRKHTPSRALPPSWAQELPVLRGSTRAGTTAWIRAVLSAVDYQTLSRTAKETVRRLIEQRTGLTKAATLKQVLTFCAGRRMFQHEATPLVSGTPTPRVRSHSIGSLALATSFAAFCLFALQRTVTLSDLQGSLITTGQNLVAVTTPSVAAPRVLTPTGELFAQPTYSQAELKSIQEAQRLIAFRIERIKARLGSSNAFQSGSPLAGIVATTATSVLNLAGSGKNGQVLMWKNGVPVWTTIPSLETTDDTANTHHRPYDPASGPRDYGGGGTTGGGSSSGGGSSGGGGSSISLPININNDTTGTLNQNRGGLGFAAYSLGDLLVGTASGGLARMPVGTQDYILTSSGGTAVWLPAPGIAAAGGWIDDGPVVRLQTAIDRVGIGTSNPAVRFQVVGSGSFTQQLAIGKSFAKAMLDVAGTMSGRGLFISGTGSSPLLMTDATRGVVGIGTAHPSQAGAALQVESGSITVFRNGIASLGNNTSYQMEISNAGHAGTYGEIALGVDVNGNSIIQSFGSKPLVINDLGNNVGIHTLNPKATLDVLGTISGSTLNISGLTNCAAIVTNSAGLLSCGFASVNTGSVIAIGDSRYVRKSGGTMTGTLNIRPTAGANTVGLNVAATMSGRALFLSGTGSQPLLATSLSYGTVLMGTGGIRSGTGMMAPQLYVAGRASPVQMSFTNCPSCRFNDITVQDRYAFATADNNNLYILDVANPETPVILGSVAVGSSPANVTVVGRYAYLVNQGEASLNIVDVSNPSAPVVVGSGAVKTGPQSLAVQGQYAYVGSSGAFQVVDISNPSQPRVVATLLGGSSLYHIVIHGTYAYMVSAGGSTMRIIDIRNPKSPKLISSTSVSSGPLGIFVQDRYAYVVNNNGPRTFQIFDVSNPAVPAALGSVVFPFGSFVNVTVQGRYAYATTDGGNLRIFDISNPRNPTLVTTVSGPSYALAVQGRYVYMGSVAGGMYIYDLGGAYVQQLEAGGIETADLSVRNGLRALDGDFRGALTVQGGIQSQGPSSFLSTSTGSFAMTITSATGGLRIAASTGAKAHIQFGTGIIFDTNLWRSAVSTLRTNGTFVAQILSGAALTINGPMTNSGTVTFRSLLNCAAIQTNSSGVLSCGVPSGSFGTGNLLAISDSRYVKKQGDTMTGVLVIQNGNNSSTTAAALLNVRGTMSGRSLLISGTGSAPLLHVDSTTNRVTVGVGTGSDLMNVRGGRLSIVRDAVSLYSNQLTYGFSVTNFGMAGTYGELSLGVDTSGNALLQSYGGLPIIMQPSGNNVGISKLTAKAKLDVNGAISGTALMINGLSTFNGNIVPNRDDAYDLGTSSARWRSLYLSGGSLHIGSNTLEGKIGYQTGGFEGMQFFSSGAPNTPPSMFISSGGLIGIGTSTPRSKLEVAGAISGSALTISGLQGCASIQSSAIGVLSCGSGGSGNFGSGNTITVGDSRYVRKSGDTMTGALLIKKLSGTSTGNTFVVDTNGLVYDATNKFVGVGTATPKANLDVLVGDSGSFNVTNFYSSSSFNSRGIFQVDSLGHMTISTGRCAGSCTFGTVDFAHNVAVNKTAEDAKATLDVNGAISGTALLINGLSTFNGNVVPAVDNAYDLGTPSARWRHLYLSGGSLHIGSSAMEGKIGYQTSGFEGMQFFGSGGQNVTTPNFFISSGGLIGIGTATPRAKLEVFGTISGSSISVSNTLTSSGGLTIRGTVALRSLTNCTSLQTDANGVISCGSGGSGTFGSGNVLTLGDRRYVKKSGDTMTGALLIKVTGGTQNTIGLNVANTISGAIVHATNQLSASGNLLVDGNAVFNNPAANTVVTITGGPDAQLNVAGAAAGGSAVISAERLGGTGNASRLDFKTDSTTYGSLGLAVGANTVVLSSQNSAVLTLQSASQTVFNVNGTIEGMRLDSTGKLGLGTSAPTARLTVSGSTLISARGTGITLHTPKATLEVLGSISGSSLFVSSLLSGSGGATIRGSIALRSLTNCPTIQSDTNGVLSCGPAVTTNFSTGNVITIGDSRYIRKSGGTMTGALTINVTGGIQNTVGLNVINTISGAIIRAMKTLASSGTLILKNYAGTSTGNILMVDTKGLVYDATNKRVGINTPGPKTALEVIGTISGSQLFASSLISGSGGLTVKGTIAFRTLANCPVISTDTNGIASCGAGTPTTFSTGNVLTIGDGRYVKKAGDTMTGTLAISVKGGNINTVALNVINTISGAIIHAQSTLGSSGALIVKKYAGSATGNTLIVDTKGLVYDASNKRVGVGTASPSVSFQVIGSGSFSTNLAIGKTFAKTTLDVAGTISGSSLKISGLVSGSGGLTTFGTITFRSLNNCAVLTTDNAGTLSCGAGTPTTFGTGNVIAIGDSRYIRKSGGTMTGALVIQNGNASTTTAVPILNVRGAMSGRTLFISGTGANALLTADSTLGYVGIGTKTPTDTLDINGDFRATNFHTHSVTRTLPLTSGSGVDIGSFNFTNGGGSLDISVVVATVNFSVSKNYTIPVQYATTGWQTVMPIGSTGPYGSDDFELDINVTNNITSLRLRRTGGGDAGIANVYIGQRGVSSDVFTPSSTASTVTTPATFYAASQITQVGSKVGIGKTTLKALLDVGGSISGSSLVISQLTGCTSLQTSSNGAFSCGSTFLQSAADARYVRKSGDTMTGTLLINVFNGTINSIGLRVINTLSGAIIRAQTLLSSSGTFVVKKYAGTSTGNILMVDSNGLVYDASNKRVGIGTSSPKTKLEVIGSISGSSLVINGAVSAQGLISGSGGTVIAGTIAFRGVNSCVNGIISDVNGVLSCGVASMSQTSADARFVNIAGDTMTGALILKNGNSPSGNDLALLLSVRGTMSGRSIWVNGSGSTPLLMTKAANGRVGIGTSTPSETLDVAGDLRLQNFHTHNVTRTIPSAVNDEVDIGTFTMNSGATSLEVDIVLNQAGAATGKHYIIPVFYSATGGAWQTVLPISSGVYNGGTDFDLEINSNTTTTSLRMRRTLGSGTVTAYVVLKQSGLDTDTFAPSTATATVSAPTVIYNSTELTQIGSQVAIGKAVPKALLDVAGSMSGASLYISGKAGFGKLSPNAKLEVLGTISGSSVIASFAGFGGNVNPTVPVDVNGEIRTTNSRTQSVIRTMPTVVNDEVDIGTYTFTFGAGSLYVDIVVPSSGNSISKQYVIPIQYDATAGAWRKALPIASTGPWVAEDFDLDVNSNAGTTSLRIRRVTGSTAGTAYVSMKQQGLNTDSFAPSSATSSVAAPTLFYGSLTQMLGKVGIGKMTPSTALDVVGTISGTALVVNGLATHNGNIVAGRDNAFDLGTNATRWRSLYLSGGSLHIGSSAMEGKIGYKTSGFEGLQLFGSGGQNVTTPSMLISSGGLVGIGTATPKTALEVVGTISGSNLFASSLISGSGGLTVKGTIAFRTLTGCTALQTDSNGVLSCGAGGTGITQSSGDARYVNTAGDTMTGALLIQSGNTAGKPGTPLLTVRGIISGSGLVLNGSGSRIPALTITKTGTGFAALFSGSVIRQNAYGTPKTMSGINVGSDVRAIAIQGQYAYLGLTSVATNDFVVADVTNPNSPKYLGGLDMSTDVLSVAVAGRYAYLGLTSVTGNDFVVVDISTPSSPVNLGGLDISAGVTNIQIQGRYAFITTTTQVKVIDISNPRAPTLVSSCTTKGGANGFFVRGNSAYITSGNSSAVLINFANIATPTGCGGSQANDQTTGRAITLAGDYIYEMREDNNVPQITLKIYKVSNFPNALASLSWAGSSTVNAYDIKIAGHYAYVAFTTDTLGKLVKVIDISNPASPREVGTYTGLNDIRTINITGKYAYLGLNSVAGADFSILDLAGADFPTANIGSLLAGDLSVDQGLRVMQNAYIGEGLQVGRGGILSQGSLAIIAHGTGSTISALDVRSASGSSIFQVRENGLVGIGSGSGLQAQATIFTTDALNQPALYIHSAETTGSQDMFQIRTNVSSTNNLVFRINASGATFSDMPYNSGGADYAEWFASNPVQHIAPGDAVCLDPTHDNQVMRCDRAADPNIMGIASFRPSVVGNAIQGKTIDLTGIPVPGYTLVGLIGQLDAHAIVDTDSGKTLPILPGDSLTSGTKPGSLRKALPGESSVGVALSGLAKGEGTIKVLIARSNKSLTVEAVEQRVSESVAALHVDDQVKASLEKTLSDAGFSDRIKTEVQSQLTALTPIQNRVTTLEASIADLRAQLAAFSGSVRTGGGQPIGTTDHLTLTGSLNAADITSENTLTVGRDARIGGDLYLDGTLKVNSIVVPGGLQIEGDTKTGKLTAASGSTIEGGFSVQGDLVLGKNLLLASGSTLSAHDLIVRNALTVLGPITINGLAQFLGDVEIKGQLKISNRQAGFALITVGRKEVTVPFTPAFTGTPIVTATADTFSPWRLKSSSATGFTLELKDPATEPVKFTWQALVVDNPLTASGTAVSSLASGIAFPVDAQGVPVSTSPIWNACIRNQVTIDPITNQPFSCARYRTDTYTWTHPDFPGLSFVYNDSLTPAMLILPEGYHAEVIPTSSSSESTTSSSSDSSVSSSESSVSSSSSSDSTTSSSVSSSSDSTTSSSSVSSSDSSSSSSVESSSSSMPTEGGASASTSSSSSSL